MASIPAIAILEPFFANFAPFLAALVIIIS
nr:MAG TPA: hypothetical protein [Caudoviricetes sp.]